MSPDVMTDLAPLEELLAQLDDAVTARECMPIWTTIVSLLGDGADEMRMAARALAVSYGILAAIEVELDAGRVPELDSALAVIERVWMPLVPEGEPRRRLACHVSTHRALAAISTATSPGGDA